MALNNEHANSTRNNDTAGSTRSAGGLNPGIVGLFSIGLLIASLVSMAVLTGGETITTPYGRTDDVVGFFADHASAVQLAAMLQLGSSVALGVYAATISARQQRLGIGGPSSGIGLFGGTTAAIMLAVSAVITWTESQTGPNPNSPTDSPI